MRSIFLVTIFVSMLFSAQQRQIIIGSFSILNNAKNYAKHVQEEVNSDAQLKQLMDKYGLKIELKKIASYNVVSICPFDGYPSLFQTIAVVKKHYPQAYAIRFPAFPSTVHTNPEVAALDVEAVKEEQLAAEAEVDDALNEEPLVEEVDAVQEAADEPIVVPEVAPVAKKPTPIPTPIPQVQETDNTQEILLLLLLLLVVIAYVVYKIKTKKKVEPEE